MAEVCDRQLFGGFWRYVKEKIITMVVPNGDRAVPASLYRDITLPFVLNTRMGRVRSIRFQCGACSKKCTTDVICCDGCKIWFHYRCE